VSGILRIRNVLHLPKYYLACA